MKQNYPLELVGILLAKGISPAAPEGHHWAPRAFLQGYFQQKPKLVNLRDVTARSKREIQALQKFPFYVVNMNIPDRSLFTPPVLQRWALILPSASRFWRVARSKRNTATGFTQSGRHEKSPVFLI